MLGEGSVIQLENKVLEEDSASLPNFSYGYPTLERRKTQLEEKDKKAVNREVQGRNF